LFAGQLKTEHGRALLRDLWKLCQEKGWDRRLTALKMFMEDTEHEEAGKVRSSVVRERLVREARLTRDQIRA
jgi:hypothetical protein